MTALQKISPSRFTPRRAGGLVDRLAVASLARIEAVSFVSPKPHAADGECPEEVVAAIHGATG